MTKIMNIINEKKLKLILLSVTLKMLTFIFKRVFKNEKRKKLYGSIFALSDKNLVIQHFKDA